MTAKIKPLAEFTQRAIEVLSRELGTADAIHVINQFTGLISDVRGYNNALSSSDVSTIYQQVLTSGAVPEPSSLALIGLGMAGSLGYFGFQKARRRPAC